MTRLTGIDSMLLLGEQPLSVVWKRFLEWVSGVISKVTEATGSSHCPGKLYVYNNNNLSTCFLVVLLAHNGFGFDYPILLSELERRPDKVSTTLLEEKNIHFSDTLPVLKKVSTTL